MFIVEKRPRILMLLMMRVTLEKPQSVRTRGIEACGA